MLEVVLVSTMGFGSYDESEQEKQDIGNTDFDDENIREDTDHGGDVNYELGKTDDMLDQLESIKDKQEQDE